MQIKYPLIRIFLSSTFKDFPEERTWLYQTLFPELREHYLKVKEEEKKAHILHIDLRWGISPKLSSEQYIVRPCIEEIKRCKRDSPYFLFMGLLGDRYGSRLLPESIFEDDFEKLRIHLNDDSQALALMKKWYHRDENSWSLPTANARKRVFSYVLQGRLDDPDWATERDTLLKKFSEICSEASSVSSLDLNPITVRNLTKSITELEFEAGVFDIGKIPPVIFRRKFPKGIIFPESYAQQEKELVDALYSRLEAQYKPFLYTYDANIANDTLNLTDFYDKARTSVMERINEAITEFHAHESAQKNVFEEELLKFYRIPFQIKDAIPNYLNRAATAPLIVTGKSGIGKTSLLLQLVKDADNPTDIFDYFIGGSTTVATIPDLLIDLEFQLANYLGEKATEIPQGGLALENHLLRLLDLAALKQKPITIIIDALDQLEEFADEKYKPTDLIRWIPEELPPQVHMIVSLLRGPALDTIKTRKGAQLITVKAPYDADAMEIFDQWMGERDRRVKPDAQREIVRKAYRHYRNPLALRVIVELALQWSYDPTSETLTKAMRDLTPRFFTSKDTKNLINRWLKSPELGRNHGPILPAYFLGLIGAGKYGVTEDELLAVLDKQQDLIIHINEDNESVQIPKGEEKGKFPPVLWARFYSEIEWMLTERFIDHAPVWSFYHRQLREAAAQRVKARHHGDLASYFLTHTPYLVNTPQAPFKQVDERMVSELAYQLLQSDRGGELRKLLLDGAFLQARIQVGQTRSAIEDIDSYIKRFAKEPDADPDIYRLRDILQLSQPILDDAARHDSPFGPLNQSKELHNQIFGRSERHYNSMDGKWAERHDHHLALESHTLDPFKTKAETRLYHQNAIVACSFNHDGTRVVSASTDQTVRVWNVITGKVLRVFEHGSKVNTCAFHPKRNLVVSGADDGAVRLWEADKGEDAIAILLGHKGSVRNCVFSPDGRFIASASDDGTVRVWDVKQQKIPTHVLKHTAAVTTCAFSKDNKRVASGTKDGTVTVWDWSQDQPIWEKKLHEKAVTTVVFNDDDTWVASASADSQAKDEDPLPTNLCVWEAKDGNSHPLKGHTGKVNDCAFHPTELDRLVSASDDYTLKLWDFIDSAWTTSKSIRDKSGKIIACCVSREGDLIFGGDWGNNLFVWDEKNNRALKLKGHTVGINALAIAPDDSKVITGSEDHAVFTWNLTSIRAALRSGETFVKRSDLGSSVGITLGESVNMIRGVAVSRDGNLVASGNAMGTLRLHDNHGSIIGELGGAHTDWVRCCAFSRDGKTLLTGSDDAALNLWQIDHNNAIPFVKLREFTGHQQPIRFCTFSPSGNYVLSAGGQFGEDCIIRIWDLRRTDALAHQPVWELINPVEKHRSVMLDCRFTQNEQTLYSTSFDKEHQILKWDLQVTNPNPTPELVLNVPLGDIIRTCDLSQDEQYLMVGYGKNIAIIELETKMIIHKFEAHDAIVNTCRFISNHSYIVSCSSDHWVKCWQITYENGATPGTQECLIAWRGDDKTIVSLEIDLAHKRLFVAEDDKLHALSIVDAQ